MVHWEQCTLIAIYSVLFWKCTWVTVLPAFQSVFYFYFFFAFSIFFSQILKHDHFQRISFFASLFSSHHAQSVRAEGCPFIILTQNRTKTSQNSKKSSKCPLRSPENYSWRLIEEMARKLAFFKISQVYCQYVPWRESRCWFMMLR